LVLVVALGGGLWWTMSLQARGREAQQHLVAARSALSDVPATGAQNDAGQIGPSGGGGAAVAQLSAACAEAAQADTLLRDVGGQMQAVMPLVEGRGARAGALGRGTANQG